MRRREAIEQVMPKIRTVRAFSAGGVLFRRAPENREAAPAAPGGGLGQSAGMHTIEVALVGRAAEDFWVLPKGTPQPDETTEQVAVREVAEETGVIGRIVGELGSVRYWFSRRGVRFHKEVLYYLMEAVSGDVALHDHEYDDARWFPLAEVLERLTYANEADVVRQAWNGIAQRSGESAT
jgi:8-oxo-dGTP pyrophosphatase MutT (NUDIX family)